MTIYFTNTALNKKIKRRKVFQINLSIRTTDFFTILTNLANLTNLLSTNLIHFKSKVY